MTLVIAHRTCPRDEPENSLAGIRRAAALGADLVEIDIRLTADGIPVLVHDRTTRRTTGRGLRVDEATADQLQALRLRGSDEPPPLFADVLAMLPRAMGLAIDLKDPAAGDAVLAALAQQPPGGPVLLWAQDEGAVARWSTTAPTHERALLRDTRTRAATARFLDDAVRVGAGAVSAKWSAISDDFVRDAHARGLRVYSWCRQRAIEPHRLALVDGIVTDWPDVARTLLEFEVG